MIIDQPTKTFIGNGGIFVITELMTDKNTFKKARGTNVLFEVINRLTGGQARVRASLAHKTTDEKGLYVRKKTFFVEGGKEISLSSLLVEYNADFKKAYQSQTPQLDISFLVLNGEKKGLNFRLETKPVRRRMRIKPEILPKNLL